MPAVRFLPVASGSKGNCYYIETRHSRVLLDCGVGIRRLAGTLRDHGVDISQLDAVLVTHTHSDHVGGLGALLARQPLRICVHTRLAAVLDRDLRKQGLEGGLEDAASVQEFQTEGFPCRDLDILPVPVSHDCDPTVAFAIWCGGVKLGVLTDLGVWQPHHIELFTDCSVLVLESNHCPELLRTGPYPPFLKSRIAGAKGHLNNGQALEFTLSLAHLPRHLMLGHLSDNNNTPQTVHSVFAGQYNPGKHQPVYPASVIPQSSTNLHGLFQSEDHEDELESEPAPALAAASLNSPIPHTVLTQLTPGPLLELN